MRLDGESLTIAVSAGLLLDDVDLVVQAALDAQCWSGPGPDRVADPLASGALVRVLDEWCLPILDFPLYCRNRKQRAAALTALTVVTSVIRAQPTDTSE